jgi:O-antigen/teichoic acid export membrane protein
LTDRRQLIRQIGAVSSIGALAQVAFLAGNILLGRHLDDGDFGRTDLANKIVNLAGYLGLFGLNTALIRAVPRDRLAAIDWPALVPRLAGVASVVALIAAALAGWVYRFDPAQAALIGAAALALSLSVGASAILAIDHRFAPSQWVQQLGRPLLFLGIVVLLVFGALGVTPVLVLFAVAGLVQVVVAWRLLATVARGREPVAMTALVRQGAVFFGLFLTSSLMLRLDAFFLAGLVSVEALGRYAAASNIALTGYGILAAGVAQVIMPRIARGEGLQLRQLLLLLTLAAVVAGVLLVLFGTPIIHAVYRGNYPGDFRWLLAGLCLAGVIQVAYVVPSAWLGAVAPEPLLRLFLGINFLSLGLNVVLNLVLIPRFGLEGAALATALSWAWRWTWAVVLVRWIRDVRARRSDGSAVVPL